MTSRASTASALTGSLMNYGICVCLKRITDVTVRHFCSDMSLTFELAVGCEVLRIYV